MPRGTRILTALSLTAALTASAGASPDIMFGTAFQPALEHGNANKIVVGRFNALHAVFFDSAIYYSTSADGDSWSPKVQVNPSGQFGKFPAIAVDSAGNVGVAWVQSPDANGVGAIKYSRKPATSSVWTTTTLNASGAEPSLVAHGGTMHVAWTQIQRVRYGQFPTLSPPATLTGEIIESTTCTASGFRKPAIAMVNDPCKPAIARVGFLVYVDEQASSGSCQSATTRVGPHVFQRDNVSATWSLIYDDTRTSTVATSTVEPASLSMASNFSPGNTFLAWSDVQNGAARTKLAHRQSTGWVTEPFNSQRMHVQLRASSSTATPTEFRFAWTGGGGFDPFFSTFTQRSTSTWAGLSPTWGAPVAVDNDGALTGRPQTLYWKRCSGGQLSTVNAYFEAEQPCFTSSVASDFSTTPGCPITPIGVAVACKQQAVLLAGLLVGSGPGVVIDVGDVGSFTQVGDTSAIVRTADGKSATVLWSRGTAAAHSGDTLTLAGATSRDVVIRGEGFNLPVSYVGYLPDYDAAVPGPQRALCLRAPSKN